MGLIRSEPKALEDFKNKLERFTFPFRTFQILECIFRQSLMVLPDTQYKYDREQINKSLFDRSLTPEDRIRFVEKHIKNWEKEHNEVYGLNKIRIDEIEGHPKLLEQMRDALEKINSLVDENKNIINEDDARLFKKAIQSSFQEKLKFNGRAVGKYLSSDNLSFKIENFDYFARYLGCAYAIFNPYFELLEQNGDEVNNKLNLFLSVKMKYEMGFNNEIQFNGKKIHNRINGNMKKVDHLRDEIYRVGLISQDLYTHLFEERHRYFETA